MSLPSLNTDRAFISHLEATGRDSQRRSFSLNRSFPIGNREEIKRVADEEGVELCLLLTDRERWSGLDHVRAELFNYLLSLISGTEELRCSHFPGLRHAGACVGVDLGARQGDRHRDGSVFLWEDKVVEPRSYKGGHP